MRLRAEEGRIDIDMKRGGGTNELLVPSVRDDPTFSVGKSEDGAVSWV